MTNGEKFKEVFGFGADGSRVIAVNATWWDCEFQNRKPATNADEIRHMDDEDLASFLNLVKWDGVHEGRSDNPEYFGYCTNKSAFPYGIDAWKVWVKQLKEEEKMEEKI